MDLPTAYEIHQKIHRTRAKVGKGLGRVQDTGNGKPHCGSLAGAGMDL